jgi:hypothetical protein
VITRHAGLAGVRLSKPGHWGNLSFDDDASATAYAIRDSSGDPMIDRPPVRRLRS